MSHPLDAPVRATLERLVLQALGAPMIDLAEVAGGASTRRYFRATTARGTAIAMHAPQGGAAEEVTAGATPRRWPFLEVRDLLESTGVRVPKLLAEACDVGLLLLEDLGDVTLAEALRRSPERREALYRRAVDDLAAMHRALSVLDASSIVRTRAFDETLLRWELAHFVEYGLDARGISRSAASRSALDEAFDVIAKELAARPRGFVHRDYQSRNLMLDPLGPARGDPDALVTIDFQDALLGPRAYDLVALMGDSYQRFDAPFVDARVAQYARAVGRDAGELREEFDRLTVQRKLKDAGRFVFIERKKGDPSFLPYIAPSLANVRSALDRLAAVPPFDRVRALLAEALPSDFG